MRAGDGSRADGVANDLAVEQAELAEELEDLDLLPYLSVGFVIRF